MKLPFPLSEWKPEGLHSEVFWELVWARIVDCWML